MYATPPLHQQETEWVALSWNLKLTLYIAILLTFTLGLFPDFIIRIL
jgi:hypothetical protein